MKTLTEELITPEMAKSFLENMIDHQRKPSLSTVAKYANEMKAGRWIVSNPISFDVNDQLIDGQHRLMAVVRAGIPIVFLVIKGHETIAAQALDIGRNRAAVDIAHLKGYEWMSQTHLSTVSTMFLSPTTSASVPLISHEQKIELLLAHKEAITFAIDCLHGKYRNACFASVLARAYYSQNTQRIQEFARILCSGVDAYQGDGAAIRLRDAYQELQRTSSLRGGRSTQEHLVRLATQGLKNFLMRKDIKQLQQATKNHFPVADFDAWWKSKLD